MSLNQSICSNSLSMCRRISSIMQIPPLCLLRLSSVTLTRSSKANCIQSDLANLLGARWLNAESAIISWCTTVPPLSLVRQIFLLGRRRRVTTLRLITFRQLGRQALDTVIAGPIYASKTETIAFKIPQSSSWAPKTWSFRLRKSQNFYDKEMDKLAIAD